MKKYKKRKSTKCKNSVLRREAQRVAMAIIDAPIIYEKTLGVWK